MGARAALGFARIDRVVCAALSPRRATMAGVEYLRPADGRAHPQFSLHTESKLPGNHESATPLVVGRRDGLGTGRGAESLDLDWPTKRTVAPRLSRGCHDHRLATGRATARLHCGRKFNCVYHPGTRAVGPGDLGSDRVAILHQLSLPRHHRGNGL